MDPGRFLLGKYRRYAVCSLSLCGWTYARGTGYLGGHFNALKWLGLEQKHRGASARSRRHFHLSTRYPEASCCAHVLGTSLGCPVVHGVVHDASRYERLFWRGTCTCRTFFPCADDPVLSFSRIRCSAPTGATDQEASAGSHRGRRYFYLHALQHSTCPIQVTCAMR